jgi:hypothetical protein
MQLLFNHLHSLFMFSCILSNLFSCILSNLFSCILSSLFSCILSSMFPYHEWSLPTFSLPTFPYPCSLSEAVSGVWFARISSNAEILRYFPSHLFPAHFSLPIFPVRSSHWRLFRKKLLDYWGIEVFPCPPFPCPLFPTHVPCQKQSVASDSQESPPLLSLCVFPLPPPPFPLFPTHFPYFDYFPAHLSSSLLWWFHVPYKLLQWQIMCELFKWTERSDYFLCTICVPPPWLVY